MALRSLIPALCPCCVRDRSTAQGRAGSGQFCSTLAIRPFMWLFPSGAWTS